MKNARIKSDIKLSGFWSKLADQLNSSMSDNQPKEIYDESILHQPKDPKNEVLDVYNLVQNEVILRLEVKDERVFIGEFTAFDKFGNFVLTNAKELFRDEERKMKMVIIPLDFVTKIGKKDNNHEKEETENTNEQKEN